MGKTDKVSFYSYANCTRVINGCFLNLAEPNHTLNASVERFEQLPLFSDKSIFSQKPENIETKNQISETEKNKIKIKIKNNEHKRS